MLSACMILLLYPLIADIRKSRFYIGPVLICTLILMGIGIGRDKWNAACEQCLSEWIELQKSFIAI